MYKWLAAFTLMLILTGCSSNSTESENAERAQEVAREFIYKKIHAQLPESNPEDYEWEEQSLSVSTAKGNVEVFFITGSVRVNYNVAMDYPYELTLEYREYINQWSLTDLDMDL